ncbi:MAG TPA: hypothetical protein VKG26_15940 [Bacteroidia bacterium]|nr:hypothetical protein [Bacteroidia bacterium]
MALIKSCKDATLFLWGKIAYPFKILPSKKYKQEITIDDIFNSELDFLITRRSEKKPEDTFDEFGEVRVDALIDSLREIPGFSMNLLGGKFKPRHIAFNPKSPASKPWDKDNDKYLWMKFIKYAVFLKPTTPIYYNIKDVHRQEFPFRRLEDANYKKLVANMANKPIVIDKKASCTGISLIKHAPNKLNYWHIEFHLNDGLTPEDDTVKKVKNKMLAAEDLAKFDSLPWADQLMYNSLMDCLATKAKKNISDFGLKKIPILQPSVFS